MRSTRPTDRSIILTPRLSRAKSAHPDGDYTLGLGTRCRSRGGQCTWEIWFCTYAVGLNGELFIELLRQLMHRRKRPVRLILDNLPAHKRSIVREYVASTAVAKGRETARPYRLRTRHRP